MLSKACRFSDNASWCKKAVLLNPDLLFILNMIQIIKAIL